MILQLLSVTSRQQKPFIISQYKLYLSKQSEYDSRQSQRSSFCNHDWLGGLRLNSQKLITPSSALPVIRGAGGTGSWLSWEEKLKARLSPPPLSLSPRPNCAKLLLVTLSIWQSGERPSGVSRQRIKPPASGPLQKSWWMRGYTADKPHREPHIPHTTLKFLQTSQENCQEHTSGSYFFKVWGDVTCMFV